MNFPLNTDARCEVAGVEYHAVTSNGSCDDCAAGGGNTKLCLALGSCMQQPWLSLKDSGYADFKRPDRTNVIWVRA